MSIQVTLDGLSIYSYEQGVDIYFAFDGGKISQEALRQLTILSLKSKKIDVYIATSHFIAVPISLYDPKLKSDYLKCQNITTQYHKSVINVIKDVVCITQISDQIFAALNRLFVEIDYHHSIEILLEKEPKDNSEVLLAICKESVMSLVHFKEGQLQLCTTIKYSTAADIAYFLSPYGSSCKTIEVYCSEVERKLLQQYFNNITFCI